MKNFLLSISKFFLLNFAVIAVAVFAIYFIFSRASYAMPEDRNVLVIGDSHTACAIDDSIFTHSVNISQGGTAYLYSYIKLRKILTENTHIDTVLVSFHSGSIQKPADEWIVGDRYILQHIPNYISLITIEELPVFMKNQTFYSAIVKMPLICIRSIFKFVVKHTLTYKDLYIGGYNKVDIDKLQRAIEQAESARDLETEYSNYQIDYLLKIVDLCAKRDVKLILFNSPIYNVQKYGNLQALDDFYNTYLTGTEYFDFSNFALPDYGYGDIGHLNFKGAEIFSKYLESNYDDIF